MGTPTPTLTNKKEGSIKTSILSQTAQNGNKYESYIIYLRVSLTANMMEHNTERPMEQSIERRE